MVEGRRNRVANHSFGSVVGLPGFVGDLSGQEESLEGGIAKICFGSVMWGFLHSKKGQHSTVYRDVRKALAGRGSDARVHRYCDELPREIGSHPGYDPRWVYGNASVPISQPPLYAEPCSFVGNRTRGTG
jgi:hypothetical protein